MYQLDFLPIAMQDMVEIATYISHELCNPEAAEKLANDMVMAAENLTDFPYVGSVYYPPKPMKKEYRKLIVKNYIMFYHVDENAKKVLIARVVYARRDYAKLLEEK